jgi:hypothetical protein
VPFGTCFGLVEDRTQPAQVPQLGT